MSEEAPPLAPISGPVDPDSVLDAFLSAMADRGLELYPEQEEAILELLAGRHVILKTPTGSGKSLVAGALLFHALCKGQKAVYTCPIKALVNEKFLALCREHGPDNVGLMTGDASVNQNAPILCCTAEILANLALCGGPRARIQHVVMDEFHFYDDPERGSAWQIPLLAMPHSQFLLLSATLGNTAFFEEDLQRRTGREAVTVSSDRRPVPLEFSWSDIPLTERIEGMAREGKTPIYLVYFTQRAATEAAQGFVSLNLCSRRQRDELAEELAGVSFPSPFGKDLKRWLRHGIGVHHAGLLPRYRLLVESLAQRGKLKLICGTDTLGVGINVPIRSVLFTQLYKYDGRKSALLKVRDFRQIAGRAGRKGFDDAGFVIAQAPEHVIENKRAEEKAADNPKKRRKLTRKKPLEGQISWDEKTFARLQTAEPESLTPTFDITHGMLLQVLSREEDGCRVLRQLIREAHVTDHRKRALRRKAFQLFRGLLDRRIIEWIPPQQSGRKLSVNVELQEDFSLHQSLSLYLVDTLEQLDPESDSYALDLLSLCEAIVEDPKTILLKQLDKLKAQLVNELKAAGVPYEERMERLQELEHPKPLREFLYRTFNEFREDHPYVEHETVHPKSIAREMVGEFLSFPDYIRRYGLQRAEGLLLRHLSQVYKVLEQTVPAAYRTEATDDIAFWLRDTIRDTDSSLLDEWERLRDPHYQPADSTSSTAPAHPPRPDTASLQRQIRFEIFRFLKETAAHDAEGPFAPFFETRERFLLDPEARNKRYTVFQTDSPEEGWTVRQTLVDPDGANDWEAVFSVSPQTLHNPQPPLTVFREVRPIA